MSATPDCTVFFEERMNRPCCHADCGHPAVLIRDPEGQRLFYCELHSPCRCAECEVSRAEEAAYRADHPSVTCAGCAERHAGGTYGAVYVEQHGRCQPCDERGAP